jgi:hypothetical protein
VDFLVDLHRIFREGSAAHAAPLQRQGNLETKFVVSWWNPNMAFYLPLAVSLITHTVAVYMQFERVSAPQRRML